MKEQFDFTTYLRVGHYKKIGEFDTYESICAEIAPPNCPLIIGIDGPASGGKTTIAKALKHFYSEKNIPVAVLPLDLFMTEREVREKLNQKISSRVISIEEYSLKAWDHKRYRYFLEAARKIIMQKSDTKQTLTIPNTYNRKNGKHDQETTITLSPAGVLITEGTGIHALHENFFDLKIRVDVNNTQILLDRVVARENIKPSEQRLAADYLLQRYCTTDLPHALYLRKVTAGKADFVIDSSDLPISLYKNHK